MFVPRLWNELKDISLSLYYVSRLDWARTQIGYYIILVLSSQATSQITPPHSRVNFKPHIMWGNNNTAWEKYIWKVKWMMFWFCMIENVTPGYVIAVFQLLGIYGSLVLHPVYIYVWEDSGWLQETLVLCLWLVGGCGWWSSDIYCVWCQGGGTECPPYTNTQGLFTLVLEPTCVHRHPCVCSRVWVYAPMSMH